MKHVIDYFRVLCSDLLYWRVCAALFGLPWLLFTGFLAMQLRPTDVADWFVLSVLALVAGFAAYLVLVSVVGSDEKFEKAVENIDDGGEWLGILFVIAVAIAAIPVTMAVRRLKHRLAKI